LVPEDRPELSCPKNADGEVPALLSESSLAKDWLSPEEEAAWTDL
jgi:hypothetical protein